LQVSFGTTEYEMIPYSKTGEKGTVGTGAYSVAFYPESYGLGDQVCGAMSGSWTSVTGSQWFGGEALETTGPAVVDCYAGRDYNDALVVGTGPAGGTAKVYVNSTGAGTTVNFRSATTKGFEVLYRDGSGTPMDGNVYEVVNTGSGDMWFTGLVAAGA
jgi:hypothetical protein